MKKLSLLVLIALVAATVAMAQAPGPGVTPGNSGNTPYTGTYGATWNAPTGGNTAPVLYGGDILGAHLGYGRGCVMCHAPHGGAAGNNVYAAPGAGYTGAGNPNGTTALWGENLSPLWGVTFTVDTNYPVTMPATSTATNSALTIMLCLSCHDGTLAKGAMMKGSTVEVLPVVGGNGKTLFSTMPGNSGTTYYNAHPVGPDAIVSCSSTFAVTASWDCTSGGGTSSTEMSPTGSTYMAEFVTNYAASFWNSYSVNHGSGGGYTAPSPLSNLGNGKNSVQCTTCHNQHSMTVYSVLNSTGVATNYATMFFIKGFYNPYTGGNSTAQFCRNCHGEWSNERYGLASIPTT